MSLTDDTSGLLQAKINTYLKEECESEIVFHIMIQVDRNEAYIDNIGTTVFPKRIKIKMCAKYDAVLKSSCEKSDLLTNFETDFQQLVSPFLLKNTPKKRIVMFPIVDKSFAVIYCVVAPQAPEEHVATFIREVSLFIWPILKKTIALEYETTIKKKCQSLLRAIRKVFAQVTCLEKLIAVATEQVKLLVNAQHCSLILIDVDKNDLYDISHKEFALHRRFPMNAGIVGEVIKTGIAINTQNPKSHILFNENIDSIPEQECSNLLCFPIREQSGILGAGLVINKIEDTYFDAIDEEMALAFSIYCGICIVHSTMYGKLHEAHVRNALADELILYHLKVDDRELANMLDCTGFHDHQQLVDLDFNHRALPLKELPCYVFRMFTDLGFDTKFEIKRCKLARFILQVRKMYREVPYHNWLHAFNTVQWAYAAIVHCKLLSRFYTELQMFMFLMAALMHDLDHRGCTTSYQLFGQTTLAALFASEGSVIERHHLAIALCILNTEGCDILENLSRRDYDRALIYLRDFIVATDVTNFVKNMENYRTIASDFLATSIDHMSALSCLLMLSADFSDQLKEWSSVKKTAASALTEFFKQSEAEKSRGEVSDFQIDKDRFFIPQLEMQFLTDICIPLFELLGMILPRIQNYTQILYEHVDKWDNARPVFAKVSTIVNDSMFYAILFVINTQTFIITIDF
ncbi:unnamed protein product [Arctia plantaginis]|uniref:3',5'-cyclic-GMP phosphodiesterase n=1 Tax=Arctia plantaginis TaxID=874455 RepID=A0A8S1B7U2_ARCPL|nr:unnamed protein product [Arctia plantaginis]